MNISRIRLTRNGDKSENGTLIDPIPPYSPHSIGRAEIPNLTIREKGTYDTGGVEHDFSVSEIPKVLV